jgi:superfamily II DNA/RNA helicase
LPVPNFRPAADQLRRNRRQPKSGGAKPTPAPAVATVTPAAPTRMSHAYSESGPAPLSATTTAAGFVELGVPARIVAALAERGIHAPFPIQAATLPDSLAGRDVLGRGRTGSGKTVAFAVPTVTRLARSQLPRQAGRPRALILVPTRELANQVATTIAPLAAASGLRITTIFGGVGQQSQVRALRGGVDVLVACPGRLEDLIGQGHCHLDRVEVTVLDEADHMADLGFLPGVKRLLERTPAGTQRLLYSATLDNGVDVLVRRYLDDPVVHSVHPAVAPVSTMTHHVFAVNADVKNAVVRELAAGVGRTLLFTGTKHGAKKLAKQLTAYGIPAVDLHGNLSQNARERNLAAFSDGSVRVLVATDIAARGIHVDDVNLVVHVDPPAEHKAYLHRSGRTARAGAGGVVVTVMTPEQHADVRALTRRAGVRPLTAAVAPGDAAIVGLTGPKAPHIEPAPKTASARTAPAKRAPAARPAGPRTSTAAGSKRAPGHRAGRGRRAA